MAMIDELSRRPVAGGNTARHAAVRERLVPNPKAKLKEQFHEVCRFKHLAVRSEEAYWGWVVRLLVFHREKAEMLKPEKLKAKSRNEGWINIPAEGLEERVKEFTAKLGLVLVAGLVSLAVALKAFNQIENGLGLSLIHI